MVIPDILKTEFYSSSWGIFYSLTNSNFSEISTWKKYFSYKIKYSRDKTRTMYIHNRNFHDFPRSRNHIYTHFNFKIK